MSSWVDRFFSYARARENIRLERALGGRGPWTDDPIFQTYRFCNVFREDDSVTTWFRDEVRGPLAEDDRVFLATVLFRWFNLPQTGHWLFVDGRQRGDGRTLFDLYASGQMSWREVATALKQRRPTGPYTTGAYMIKTPAGMDKVDGVMWCVEQFFRRWIGEGRGCPKTIKATTEWLSDFPFLGPFMAYEIATDLRHTDLLRYAPDIMTWANPGPGAARGLDRLGNDPLGTRNRNKQSDVDAMVVDMQRILAFSRFPDLWPWQDRPWEMRDVEHTLCEFDKYERVRLGEGRPKQLFRPTSEMETT